MQSIHINLESVQQVEKKFNEVLPKRPLRLTLYRNKVALKWLGGFIFISVSCITFLLLPLFWAAVLSLAMFIIFLIIYIRVTYEHVSVQNAQFYLCPLISFEEEIDTDTLIEIISSIFTPHSRRHYWPVKKKLTYQMPITTQKNSVNRRALLALKESDATYEQIFLTSTFTPLTFSFNEENDHTIIEKNMFLHWYQKTL